MYEYNKEAISKLIEKKVFSQRSLSETINVARPTILRWINGKDLHVTNMLKICNTYKIPLGEFISENGIPVSPVYTDNPAHTEAMKESSPEQTSNVAEIMRYEEQIESIKRECDNRLNRMEKDFLERIGDIREAAAEKWAKKNAEALMNERRILEAKYEGRIKEQNEEIIRLREELATIKARLGQGMMKVYENAEILCEPNPDIRRV